ncbi:LOW QUALITY PROTEIN: Protein VAC14-like protein [Frankliniella fusca]|uniref:Protein VAC14-like protein n=1 Tax=Frankliniella fusca TaxID=407009 RepID=A0AAE1HS96_9NEOP|nr:LOW QUALITY PROTEIN: Protein VAC14-like protein [Frankliniella fusca]
MLKALTDETDDLIVGAIGQESHHNPVAPQHSQDIPDGEDSLPSQEAGSSGSPSHPETSAAKGDNMWKSHSTKYKKARLERQMEIEIDKTNGKFGTGEEALHLERRGRPEGTKVANCDETYKLVTDLRKCFGDHGITQSAQNDILALFRARGFPDLPQSRVIMNTTRGVSHLIQSCSNGHMYYFGIAQGVRRTVTSEYLAKCTKINLDFFTDGLSPYKSVKSKVWPILCRLSATSFSYESVPFLVSVFGGKTDPIPQEFLKDFVCEAKDLETNGMKINGIRYEVYIKKFIADQPARAKLKCVNGEGPSSLVQCERCTIIGKHSDRITHFSGTEVRVSQPTLRTDKTFRQRLQPAYHKINDSPLLALNIDMVFSFPLDPMHILYIGVVKRYWDYLVEVKGAIYHITKKNNNRDISIYELKHQLPTDFSRSVRGLDCYKLFKATEWRRFLLYDGILVFKKFMPRGCYKNFLLLSCAVRILSTPECLNDRRLMLDAQRLLEIFVLDCEKKFGKNFLSIKMHCLTHIVKDVENHGPLDSFSAFPFESYLSRINKCMRAHGRCVEQIVARVREGFLLQPVPVVLRSLSRPQPALSCEVTTSASQNKREYLKAVLPSMVICAARFRDSIFKTFNGDVLRVTSIQYDSDLDEVFVVGFKFLHSGDFFHTPLRSRVVGVEKVSMVDSSETQCRIQDIKCKCVLMTYKSRPKEWLCITMVHDNGVLQNAG